MQDINRIAGRGFATLFHRADREAVSAHMDAIGRAKDNDIFEIEYRFKKADGRWMWCLSRDSVFARNPDGSVRQFMGTFLDITSRRQTEEDLRKVQDELEIRIAARTKELKRREALLEEQMYSRLLHPLIFPRVFSLVFLFFLLSPSSFAFQPSVSTIFSY